MLLKPAKYDNRIYIIDESYTQEVFCYIQKPNQGVSAMSVYLKVSYSGYTEDENGNKQAFMELVKKSLNNEIYENIKITKTNYKYDYYDYFNKLDGNYFYNYKVEESIKKTEPKNKVWKYIVTNKVLAFYGKDGTPYYLETGTYKEIEE